MSVMTRIRGQRAGQFRDLSCYFADRFFVDGCNYLHTNCETCVRAVRE